MKNLKEAKQLAAKLRAEGKTVKIYRHEGIYTQPGIGIASYCYYEVR
jgi:hypothetical protein